MQVLLSQLHVIVNHKLLQHAYTEKMTVLLRKCFCIHEKCTIKDVSNFITSLPLRIAYTEVEWCISPLLRNSISYMATSNFILICFLSHIDSRKHKCDPHFFCWAFLLYHYIYIWLHFSLLVLFLLFLTCIFYNIVYITVTCAFLAMPHFFQLGRYK